MRGLTLNLGLVSRAARQGPGDAGKLITDESLYKDMRTLSAELKSTAGSLGRVMKDVEAGKGSLGKLVRDESLYDEARLTHRGARRHERVKDALGGFKSVSAQLSDGKGPWAS